MKNMMIHGKIPYEIRKPEQGYLSVDDVEHILEKAWIETGAKDFPRVDDVEKIFLDNRDVSDLLLTVYKGCVYPEKTIYLNAETANGHFLGTIAIAFESGSIKPNIVKETCKELGLTYKELGEAIGYSEPAIKKAVQTNKVSEPMQKAIDLYIETISLKEKLKNTTKLTEALKELLN